MNTLWARIKALEADVRQAERDHLLLPRWERELHEARTAAHHEGGSHPLPRFGVDYSYWRPTADELHRLRATFALRYLTGGDGKALSGEEAHRLKMAGVAIGSLFEEGAENMKGGERQGIIDANAALRAAHGLKMPKGRPIYFCADWDVQPPEEEACLAYLRAAKVTMNGHYFAGVYGGLRLIQAAKEAGFHFLYQTLAWSGGVWDPSAQLRQTNVGANYDPDYAHALDFGQWQPS